MRIVTDLYTPSFRNDEAPSPVEGCCNGAENIMCDIMLSPC